MVTTHWLKYLSVGLILLVLGAPQLANAQTLDAEIKGDASIWTSDDRCYQHTFSARGTLSFEWSLIFAEAFLSGKWWGACDAKIPGSPLNAEARRTTEREHGANAGLKYKNVQLGLTIRRDAVQHYWRSEAGFRHRHFAGSWQIGRRACTGGTAPSWPEGGPQCPSLGYYDGITIYLGYEGHGIDAEVTGPRWFQWKSLTLPWPNWTWDVRYDYSKKHSLTLWKEFAINGFSLGFEGQAGGPAYAALNGEALVKVTPRFSVGIRGGRTDAPGWTKPLHFTSFVIEIQQ